MENMEKILIINKKLNKPYVSEDRESYLYLNKEIAKIMADKNEKFDVIDVSDKSLLDIKSLCFLCGALKLLIIGNSTNDIKIEELIKEDLKPMYYNSNLNANINNLLSTRKQQYLLSMKGCKFIVPVVVKDDEKQSISYLAANTKNNSFFYVAFSDLSEYNKWSKDFPQSQPLEVDSISLKRIGKDHGFIFNPSGNKFILTRDMLKMIPNIEEEDDHERRDL